ncbi:hypothetical protein, variant 1 [Cryptococcus amylolentus CBS 6039]|uniref:NADP-dependent oxidoreductase domain-containing protein n=1 Tax=Cryptococcus amylolentus CBS 6039 TaxID=1295533 RepID=A0A1E3I9H3_9TREE|nr:hypothetical protein, variant 1 [Cryptococcus amylolentus CBS 6039]ODN84496.1 hypothetical protein, variant 1 [Cryptococcus amylolentus CBS 6039]
MPIIRRALSTMSKRTFTLNDGKVVPALAWGSGTSGIFGNADLAVKAGVVALEKGFKHVDTAQVYHTEEAVGQAVKKSGLDRKSLFLTTKISEKLPSDREAIRKSVAASVEKLQSKPDLLIIHFPSVARDGDLGKFWTELEELVLDGTLEGVSLGVSNFRPQDLEAILKVARIKPTVNRTFQLYSSRYALILCKELEYHPYVLTHLAPILKIGKEHNIITESYGALTPILRHPTGGPLKPVLERIAQRLSKDTGKELDSTAVLILWTIQKGVIAVTTSKTDKRIESLVAIDDLPDLTAEEVKEIEEVGSKVHFRHYTVRTLSPVQAGDANPQT